MPDPAWMASMHGRHQVDLGTSLIRALKARAGESTNANKRIPVNGFYSFRYKFKPESIDDAKPGLVESKPNSDGQFKVERPSVQAGDSHIFTGTEVPAREWECVLILDEETGIFRLEKLDSLLDLAYDGRSQSKAQLPSQAKDETLSGGSGLEDADGEADLEAITDLLPAIPVEPEAELPLPLPPPLEPKRKRNPSPPKSPSKKAKGKPAAKATKAKAKKAKEQEESDLEEMVIPSRPMPLRKASTASSTRTKPSQRPLALPGSSSANVPPRPADILVPPPSHPPQFNSRYEGSDSEDDDMEAVIPDDEHEIDADAIARELENMMSDDDATGGDNDDYKAAAAPLSLNQYAGGQSEVDDDFSSSDSDD